MVSNPMSQIILLIIDTAKSITIKKKSDRIEYCVQNFYQMPDVQIYLSKIFCKHQPASLHKEPANWCATHLAR